MRREDGSSSKKMIEDLQKQIEIEEDRGYARSGRRGHSGKRSDAMRKGPLRGR